MVIFIKEKKTRLEVVLRRRKNLNKFRNVYKRKEKKQK